MNQQDDNELIALARAGDMQAFRQIVERYESRVATVVRNMLGNVVEVEDVGQEVFMRLYKALSKFRGDAQLGTYITRIAINLSLNEIKKRNRRRWIPFARPQDDSDRDIADESANPNRYDNKELVNIALQRLKPDYRTVVVLRLVQGYSVKETAELLGLPQGTILSRQARATAKLREELKLLKAEI